MAGKGAAPHSATRHCSTPGSVPPEVVLCSLSAVNPERKHHLKRGVVEKRAIPPMDFGAWGGKKAVQSLGRLPSAWLSHVPPSCHGQARAGRRGLSTRGPGSSARGVPLTSCLPPSAHRRLPTLRCQQDLAASLSPHGASRLVRACPLGQPTNHGPPYRWLLWGQPANTEPALDI